MVEAPDVAAIRAAVHMLVTDNRLVSYVTVVVPAPDSESATYWKHQAESRAALNGLDVAILATATGISAKFTNLTRHRS